MLERIQSSFAFYVSPKSYFTTFEEEFLKCNKTLLAGGKKTLQEWYIELSDIKNSRGIYYGKDKFRSETKSFGVGRVQWDRLNIVKKRLHSLLHSHIYFVLQENPQLSNYIKTEKAQARNSGSAALELKTESNLLISTYALCFSGILLCLTTLVCELFINCGTRCIYVHIWLALNSFVRRIRKIRKRSVSKA